MLNNDRANLLPSGNSVHVVFSYYFMPYLLIFVYLLQLLCWMMNNMSSELYNLFSGGSKHSQISDQRFVELVNVACFDSAETC